MKIKYIKLIPIILIFSSSGAISAVSLNMTRVVFNRGSTAEVVEVNNSTHDGNYLIQSWVSPLDGEDTTLTNQEFIITPPLFKLNDGEKNKIKIMLINQDALPKDRESSFWLNVKSIPSLTEKQVEEKNKLLISVNTKVKIFVRPTSLSPPGSDVIYHGISWKMNSDNIDIHNNTSYYITLKNIKFDGVALKNVITQNMIKPFSEISAKANPGTRSGSHITWGYINDFGSTVDNVESTLQ